MVKKIKTASKPAEQAGTPMPDHQLRSAVKDSAKHIWLAGLGAFAKTQAEGGKMFETLVKEGRSLQRKTQAVAEGKISEVTGKMTAMADTVSAKAGKNWDKLETIFEARTARAMSKLGVPTAKDLESLAKRVEALAAAVAKLSGQAPARRAAPARKAATPKAKAKAEAPAAAPARKAPVKRAARKTAA